MAGGKLHELFAMDFLNSHHHTDRRDAAGLNEHRKNLGILRGLLFTRKDLLLRFSAAEAQDDTLLKDLLHLYYTTEAPPPKQEADTPLSSTTKQNHSLSLGCCLDDDQLSLIADCANEARAFVEELDASMLRSLLEGKLTVPCSPTSLTSCAVMDLSFPVGRTCWNRPEAYSAQRATGP